jgi:hypothetical protein
MSMKIYKSPIEKVEINGNELNITTKQGEIVIFAHAETMIKAIEQKVIT